jgi:hypothetical protein
VFYDALSRRILSANAGFGDLDSAAAASLADSLARTLDNRGGQGVQCGPIDPVVVDMWRADLWRFPSFDVRLLGYRPLASENPPRPNGWRVGLIALPMDAPDCRFVRRLHN